MIIKFQPSKILFFVCKAYGMIPLNHRKNNSRSIANYFVMVFLPITYLVALITIFAVRPFSLVIGGCKSICFFSNLTFLMLGGFTYLVCVISSQNKCKFFASYYDQLEKFDEHFNKFNPSRHIKIKTDYVKIIMVILAISIFFGLGALGTSTYLKFKPDLLGFLHISMCTVFPLSATSFYQLLFTHLVQEIGWRYEKINYIFRIINKQCLNNLNFFNITESSEKIKKEVELGNLSGKTDKKVEKNDDEESDDEDEDDDSDSDDLQDLGGSSLHCERYMVDLFQIHEQMSTLGVCINKEFASPIVSYMTATFIISIFAIFLLTKVLFTINNLYELLLRMTIYVILWASYLMVVAYLILRICCHAQTEARKTALLIHEIMQKKPTFMLGNDDYYNKMKCFTLQYLHWESYFNFNGNGLFQLDYTFIFSAVSAGTSYLIVLLQFDLNAVL